MEIEEFASDLLQEIDEKPRIFYDKTWCELREGLLEKNGKEITSVKFFRADKENLEPSPKDKIVFYAEDTKGYIHELTRGELN